MDFQHDNLFALARVMFVAWLVALSLNEVDADPIVTGATTAAPRLYEDDTRTSSPVQNCQTDPAHEVASIHDTDNPAYRGVFAIVAEERLRIINRLISHRIADDRPTCQSLRPVVQLTQPCPRDCAEIQSAGYNESGRYVIEPDGAGDPFVVYCDMDTDGGGWTVLQRRQDGSVDFYNKWLDYKYGFGNVDSEHWLGNDKIHRLTSQKVYKLRVDIADFEGGVAYAEYESFLVAGEELNYRLILGDYNEGTAEDSMTYHHGHQFSTHDADNDANSGNCAVVHHGAWWYNACAYSNLNGQYYGGGEVHTDGVTWYRWKGNQYSMKKSEMKIYPNN